MPEPRANGNLYKRGDVIGGIYEIYSILGRGGFGVVYLALHLEQKEPYALKTFRDEFLNDCRAREAFEKEALLWVHLEQHPFILAARHVREFYGRLFVAMDYVPPDAEGMVTLSDHLRSGKPLGQEQVLEWAVQFCLGMEHAISHGLKCHRDIKPANILICDGSIRISDFGLAAATEMAWRAMADPGVATLNRNAASGLSFSVVHTNGKASCGTPGYMPPEVYRGEGADVRSDIYSFGLVLWQMATGSPMPPFVGAFRGDVETFMRAAYERQMLGQAPAAPSLFRAVIEQCLQPDPSRRYASFKDLREVVAPLFTRLTGKAVTIPTIANQSAALWDSKGTSLAALGRRQEAIVCYDKALALNSKDPRIWSNKGFLLHQLRCYEEGIYCYDRALALEQRLGGIWGNKAASLAAVGRYDDAIACHDKALALDPGRAALWSDKGSALHSARRFREAIACFDKATAIDPRFVGAWANKGVALASLGSHEDAIACYKHALGIDPQDSDALYHLSRAFSTVGRHEDADRAFDAAKGANPRDGSMWLRKAEHFNAEGRFEEAIACYDEALRIEPRNVSVLQNKGSTLVSLRRYSEALECYNAALAIVPADPRHWFNKAYAEDQLGRGATCVRAYRRFIELAPVQYSEQISIAQKRIMELDAS